MFLLLYTAYAPILRLPGQSDQQIQRQLTASLLAGCDGSVSVSMNKVIDNNGDFK